MEIDFVALMENKSEDELRKYLTESKRYRPEAVAAAINELEKRGINTSTIDNASTSEPIQEESIPTSGKPQKLKNKVVTDPSAPLYYSEDAVSGFAFFFGTLAGALLLFHNLRNAGKKSVAAQVLAIGISYTILVIILANTVKANIALPLNILGSFILMKQLWKKHLGNGIEYRAKSITAPLIIWLTITAILITLIIWGSEPNT